MREQGATSTFAEPKPASMWAGFLRTAERLPDHPAALIEGNALTYAELADAARGIAATLQQRSPEGGTPLTAVLAKRSRTAFAGVLGSLLSGNGYVPLNPDFPHDRSEHMLRSSGTRTLVVDGPRIEQAVQLLEGAEPGFVVLAPDADDVDGLRARLPQHTILGDADLLSAERWEEPAYDPEAIAYLLFTSGSTGTPKGVMVAHRNIRAFLDYMLERYRITEADRFSHMFDLTFDLSIFDMFMCWEGGACLCCPSERDVISPGRYIDESELTVWFSVPSTAVLMKRLGALKPGRYPGLRLSLFCGEPLPSPLAAAWQEAAPNSDVENLYGPTETTLTCTVYRWDSEQTPRESELEIVPIGYLHPGMEGVVVDEALQEVPPGEVGELALAGPQVTPGYWRDEERTAAAFIELPGRSGRYYKTGDRVRRPAGDGPLTYLGRTDFQVKVRGFRVELGEIEAAIRAATGLDGVLAIPWPALAGSYSGIEAFIEGPEGDVRSLRAALEAKLPDYMVPRRFHFFERLPRNANNKFDRKAVTALLEEGL